eukprot:5853770-Pleurochrysis_carterae.AAC.1
MTRFKRCHVYAFTQVTRGMRSHFRQQLANLHEAFRWQQARRRLCHSPFLSLSLPLSLPPPQPPPRSASLSLSPPFSLPLALSFSPSLPRSAYASLPLSDIVASITHTLLSSATHSSALRVWRSLLSALTSRLLRFAPSLVRPFNPLLFLSHFPFSYRQSSAHILSSSPPKHVRSSAFRNPSPRT